MNLVIRRVSVPIPGGIFGIITALLTGVLLLSAATFARADTFTVTANGGGDYPTLQAAIDNAPAGSTIVVGPGTYHESLSWSGKKLTLQAGWVLQGAQVGPSIIDPSSAGGGPGGRCLYTSGLTADSRLEGFTFQNGSVISIDYGGGMYNFDHSSPTVTRCTFSGNQAFEGGGMYNFDHSSPTVTHCIFANNSGRYGGGMYNVYNSSPTVTHCTFTGNSGSYGSGMYNDQDCNSTVTNCAFSDNTAGYDGGGMNNFRASPTVTNCTFTDNTATDGKGGGMYTFDSSFDIDTIRLTNCAFAGNSAKNGGGMYNRNGDTNPNFVVTNCTFTDNTATDGHGGGMYNDLFDSTVTVTNCILWGNRASSSGDGMYTALPSDSSTTVTDTDLQDLSNPFTARDANGNFSDDPLFVDAAHGNLRIPSGSPCVDAGDDTAVAGIATDLAGKDRIHGAHVDLGAYELPANNPPTASSASDPVVTATHMGDPTKDTASVTLDGSGSDPDGDAITLAWDDGKGDTAPVAQPTFTLHPGGYTFTLTVTDAYGAQSTTTANVTVNDAPNRVPGANGQGVSLDQDTSKSITLTGSDPDGTQDSLTYRVATSPAHGTLTGTGANLTYQPAAGYHGPDSLTFTVTDPYGAQSNTATVSLTVKAVDTTAPVITTPGDMTATATSTAGKAVTFSVTAMDAVDGSVPVTCTPASGSVFAPGKTTVRCSASDKAGNPASKTFVVWVQYGWSGFLSPLSKGSANRGNTLPVKFQLTGESANITNLSARLYVTGPGSSTETLVSTFTYDRSARQYQYDWNTSKTLSAGAYTLRADLGDAVPSRTVSILLK